MKDCQTAVHLQGTDEQRSRGKRQSLRAFAGKITGESVDKEID